MAELTRGSGRKMMPQECHEFAIDGQYNCNYTWRMEFEWDRAKSQRNLEKHGISFEDACRIFEGPVLTKRDDRFEYGEARFTSIGSIENLLIIVVVHTDRNGRTRLISARRANRRERALFNDAIKRKT
ncbi:BrnT family toxin [Martelella sp. FLE1502]